MSQLSADVLRTPDPVEIYQAVYDSLKNAYWDATDIEDKDLIYGAQQAIGEMIRTIDDQALALNTALYLQLEPKMKAVNVALCKIKNDIDSITKNIGTAGSVLAAINKVLALFPV